MNETEFKRIFKNSVKHIGGFAASMGSNLGGGTIIVTGKQIGRAHV